MVAASDMGTPRISVIIPAYNQGHYLEQAVNSVLEQTYPNFEIIVVDDGSTDHTQEVAGSFSDPRVLYLYQENRGLSAARNTGIRRACGEFLTFLDSDDLFLPEKLERLLDKLEADPALGLVAGQAIPIDEHGRRVGKIFDQPLPVDGRQLLLGNPLHVGSVLLRRVWQEKAGFFDEKLRSYEDWDLWLRLAWAGCPMGWVAHPVSLYRFHRAQMTRDGSQMTTATFAVLEKTFSDPTLPEDWQTMRDAAYSQAHLRAAAQAYRVADIEAGKQHLEQAATLNPTLLQNEGERLSQHIVGWTELPKISDPLTFMARIYENLPPSFGSLERRRRGALGEAALRLAFEAYRRGDLRSAHRAVRRAIVYQPTALKNRGVLAVLIKSYPLCLRR